MDKSQKELIKTYYRKRNMSIDSGDGFYSDYLRDYEIQYGLNNKIINDNMLKSNKGLFSATAANDIEWVKASLKQGADPNLVWFGMNPLHWGISYRNYEIIELLLKAGANPYIKYTAGGYDLNSFELADSYESQNIISLLNLYTNDG